MPAVKQVLAKVDTNAKVFSSSINLCFQALMIVHEQFNSRYITTTPSPSPSPSSSSSHSISLQSHNLPVLATYLLHILSYMEIKHKCLKSSLVTKNQTKVSNLAKPTLFQPTKCTSTWTPFHHWFQANLSQQKVHTVTEASHATPSAEPSRSSS